MSCIAPRRVGSRDQCQNSQEPGSLFCRRHEMAPAARRGGWISAERRRRKMAAGERPLDISNIVPRLWVGGEPPFDRDLPAFDVLVLCAREIQPAPDAVAFRGHVVRCPVSSDQLTTSEVSRVLTSAKVVADSLLAGKRVLVTCAAGDNRSVLVAALALNRITRMGVDDLVRVMRLRRNQNALCNGHFVDLLRVFTSRRR